MKNSHFLEKMWTGIMLDEQMAIMEVTNPESRLFFGKSLVAGMTINEAFTGTAHSQQQLMRIMEGIACAKEEKRTVCLEYFSIDDGNVVPVTVFVEYSANNVVYLHATAIHADDSNRMHTNSYQRAVQDMASHVRLQKEYETLYNQLLTIINSLPVGVEVYDGDGRLIYLNDTDFRIFGLDKNTFDIGRVTIQDNPNLPLEVKEGVAKGIHTHASFLYNFNVVKNTGFYSTSQRGVIRIECNGRPVVDASGRMENYVFIVHDATEDVRLNEELRQSKQKFAVAMHAADIMLWEFDVPTRLFFSDNEPMNGYDSSSPVVISEYITTLHPDDRATAAEVIGRMCTGESFSFKIDVRVKLPDHDDWQYCAIDGSPVEKGTDGMITRYIGTRKNNTELQKKKLLQENILNNIPVSIHIKDVEDNYRYTFCNDESKRLFGTDENTTIYEVMDIDKAVRIEKTDREVFITGKPYFGLEHIELNDGRTYDTFVRKSIIYDEGRRLLLSIRWDQSLQNDLERRAKILNITMEAMNAYTWLYEPEKDKVSFGEGSDKIGHSPLLYDTLGKFVSFVHPDERQLFLDSIQGVIDHRTEQWNVEYRADLNGDGIYEWWQTRGMIETTQRNDMPYTYMFGMTINIEKHKQAEMTLLRNREELNRLIRQNEMVLNNTNSGLAYITSDYIVQWENITHCLKVPCGIYEQGELCYKSARGRTSSCEDCVMRRAFASHEVERINFIFGDRIAEIFATPVFKEDGSLDGAVIRVDDITEREKMIEDLKHAVESDKLKSAFLANMSHEIRTPLNAIIGFSEILMDTTDEKEKGEYIDIINNNNELLLKLINDILDLSKIEAGAIELKYEEFDLSAYFDGLALSMKPRITKSDVRLIVANPFRSCTVILDKNRVAQILTNYITNAIKYTQQGQIEMGYRQVEQGIRFYVKDTGIGIPDEKKHKVFFRFEKLDEFAQGTGLGLSICKAIAETMGGSVGFSSKHGEGSEFWALLPCQVKTVLE